MKTRKLVGGWILLLAAVSVYAYIDMMNLLKALSYKEWMKTRKLVGGWILLLAAVSVYAYIDLTYTIRGGWILLLAAVSVYAYIDLTYTIRMNEAVNVWFGILFQGTSVSALLMYMLPLAGISLAIVQFVPEMTQKRFKLTLHLPASETRLVSSISGECVVWHFVSRHVCVCPADVYAAAGGHFAGYRAVCAGDDPKKIQADAAFAGQRNPAGVVHAVVWLWSAGGALSVLSCFSVVARQQGAAFRGGVNDAFPSASLDGGRSGRIWVYGLDMYRALVAGLAGYGFTAWICIEPCWKQRAMNMLMAAGLLSVCFVSVYPEAYAGFGWGMAVLVAASFVIEPCWKQRAMNMLMAAGLLSVCFVSVYPEAYAGFGWGMAVLVAASFVFPFYSCIRFKQGVQ